MKYRVVHNTQRITIDVEAPATGADRLLEALRRCEEGRCDRTHISFLTVGPAG